MHKMILKLSLKFLMLGVFTGSLGFYQSHSFSQAGSPRIVVTQQPDSPMLIVTTYVDSSNLLGPRYGYSITNTSDKPIRAFTIQESVTLGAGAPIIGTSFSHMPVVQRFLMPHDLRQQEGGLGRAYQSPPIEVELTVDFVEFADGTRWGADKNNSGDRLDGIRAGGKTAIKKYREILANEGAAGLEQALINPTLIKPDSRYKSEKWLEGFNIGVSSVKSRLTEAKAKKGQAEVKRELDKPFDSTESRQEP